MDFLTIMTTFGIGGIVGAIVKYWLDNKKVLRVNLNQINEEKYRTLLIHMSCALDVNNRRYFTIKKDYEEDTQEYYMGCVKEYYYNSLLYSPDFVIIELKRFIEGPSKKSFIRVARAMRRDLWRSKTKLSVDQLVLK